MAKKRTPKPAPPPETKGKEKAFFFRVRPDEGDAAEIERILGTWTREHPTGLLDLEQDGVRFQLCEPNWHESRRRRIFSATVVRFGSGPLPPAAELGVMVHVASSPNMVADIINKIRSSGISVNI
jgi:hypothetical protein